MKLSQPREAMPLTVWIALAVITSDCQIWSPSLPAKPAAGLAPMSGRSSSPLAWEPVNCRRHGRKR